MDAYAGKKKWRLELSNPETRTDWKPLWEFDEDQYAPHRELIEELNRINAPVQLRIVQGSD